MERQDVLRVTFGYSTSRASVKIAFVADVEPAWLLVAITGPSLCYFDVEVHDRCYVKPWLEKYGQVMDALGLQPDPANRFKPGNFLREIASHAPDGSGLLRPANPSQIARHWSVIDEADKTYFMHWMPQSGGRHVTAQNLAKTRVLVGADAAERCRRLNISSMWSANPEDERTVTAPCR